MSADTAMNLSAIKRDPVSVEQNFSAAFNEKMQLSSKSDVLIRSLIDMYKDSMEAVIREYAANALDSHIMAGQTRPIEVTLPSAYGNDCLIIRDYGVGLNEEGLRKYVHLGESSKDGDDSQTGIFGMGSKSGLSLASQFTVIAVQDGIKRVVTIGEDAEGGISLDGMKVVETEDPNGVTVSIPVSADKAHEAKEKAENFFRHWEPGTVLINGAEPEHISSCEGYMSVDDHHMWNHKDSRFSRSYSPELYVKMGAVTYKVDMYLVSDEVRASLSDLMRNYDIILTVPARSMDLVLNRDSVIYSSRTIKTIQDTVEDFFKSLTDKINTDIDAHMQKRELKEAAILYLDFLNKVPNLHVPSYNGIKFDTKLEIADKNDMDSRLVEAVRGAFDKISYHGKKDRKYGGRDTYRTLNQQEIDNLHIVYIDDQEYNRAIRGASAYILSENIKTVIFALGDFKQKEWIDNLYRSITFEEFYEIVKEYRKENKTVGNAGNNVPRPVQYSVFTIEDGENIVSSKTLAEIRESEDKDYYFWNNETAHNMPNFRDFVKIFKEIEYKPVILVGEGKKLQTMKNRFKNLKLTDLRETLKSFIFNLDTESFLNMCRTSLNEDFAILSYLVKETTQEMRDELGEIGKQITELQEYKTKGEKLASLAELAFETSRYYLKFVPEIVDRWKKDEEAPEAFEQAFKTDRELIREYPLLDGVTFYRCRNEIGDIIQYVKAMDMMKSMQNKSA